MRRPLCSQQWLRLTCVQRHGHQAGQSDRPGRPVAERSSVGPALLPAAAIGQTATVNSAARGYSTPIKPTPWHAALLSSPLTQQSQQQQQEVARQVWHIAWRPLPPTAGAAPQHASLRPSGPVWASASVRIWACRLRASCEARAGRRTQAQQASQGAAPGPQAPRTARTLHIRPPRLADCCLHQPPSVDRVRATSS